MSAKQPIQAKGDIVYNPKTNRPIKVGSRAWLNLVKQGVIAGEYADDNVLDEYNEEESKQEIKKRIKELNEKQDAGTQVVRGRGVYKGKLVKRSKALSVQDISKKTSKIASKIVVDDDEKLEKELEAMIYNELMKGKPKKVKQPVSKPLKQPKPKMSRSKTVPVKKPVVVETEDEEQSDTNNYSENYKIQYEDDDCVQKEDDWSSEDE